jgi:GH25 family lysozyme M1 (1,4-beta-N-acetylmuramidase)
MTNQSDVRGMQAGYIPLTYLARRYFRVFATGAPIPPEDRARGCDTSHWDGLIHFPTMKNAGALFCIFKATQGIAGVDDQFNNSRNNVGILMPWAGYHFLTTEDGTAQANNFCNAVGNNPGKLIPTLDVELRSVNSSIIKAYCVQHYARIGKYPVIYTSAYFWDMVTGTDKAWISTNCKLWVAHWGTLSPILPAGWATYLMHQYSADGNNLGRTYGGQADDMDLNYCRLSWLRQYVLAWAKDITAWARTQPNPYTGPDPE